MPKVLIAPSQLKELQGPWLNLFRESGWDYVFNPTSHQLTEPELMDALKGMDASLAGSEPYTPEIIAAHPQLRVIARAGVGYDAVDVAAATDRGIAVCTTPGTNHDAVAEYTFTLMLALAKNLVNLHLKTMAGGCPRQVLVPLRGRTLAIVGLGRIGKAVALRGKAFGMKVIAFEPYPDQKFVAEQGIPLMPLEDVLR